MKKLLLCPHWNHTMSATFIELDTAEIDDFPSLGTMQHVHTPAGWPRLPAILICTYVLPCARGACNTRPRSGMCLRLSPRPVQNERKGRCQDTRAARADPTPG
jgi:hypothetical protein